MVEDKNAVSQRHRDEWRAFRESFFAAGMTGIDLDDAKLAKAVADILKVYQEGERKAYGFAEVEGGSISMGWLDGGEEERE